MTRLLFASTLGLLLACATQFSQAGQVPAPIVGQSPSPPPQVVDAKVENGMLIVTKFVEVAVEFTVEVERGGQKVAEKRVRMESIPTTSSFALTNAKATDGDGKAIAADTLKERLKEQMPIVISTSPIADRHRKLFKTTVIFVELPALEIIRPKPLAPPAPIPTPIPIPKKGQSKNES